MIGLRAIQPNAAVVKVMSIPDNRCIRVVIPDYHVGTDGFHEVLIHDMADADAPYVAIGELGTLRLDWPRAIFSLIVYALWELYSPRSGPACRLLSFGFGPALAVPGVLVHCMAGNATGLY